MKSETPKPITCLTTTNQALKSEMSRTNSEALGQSDRPLTAQEIAQHVMVGRGLAAADQRMVKLIGKRVGSCLRHHRERGLVRSARGTGQFLVWEIAR